MAGMGMCVAFLESGGVIRRFAFKKCIQNPIFVRAISTSKKNDDTNVQAFEDQLEKVISKKKSHAPLTLPKTKNWVSFGFSYIDEENDIFARRLVLFSTITVFFCFTAFLIIYFPDHRLRNWALMEAHLELHRREKLGLPLIDKNYVDPGKIELPTDEEIGDMEVML